MLAGRVGGGEVRGSEGVGVFIGCSVKIKS